MSSISQHLYNQVMMADDFTCVYCGERTEDITIDHFVPRSVGGPEVLHNLFACCWPCNRMKGDKPAHLVGMPPRYGRFGGMRDAGMLSQTATHLPEWIAALIERPVRDDLTIQQIIGLLAIVETEDGAYRFSNERIMGFAERCHMEGAAEVLANIRRPANGWGKAS